MRRLLVDEQRAKAQMPHRHGKGPIIFQETIRYRLQKEQNMKEMFLLQAEKGTGMKKSMVHLWA